MPALGVKRAEKLIGRLDSFQVKIWLYFRLVGWEWTRSQARDARPSPHPILWRHSFGMNPLAVRRGAIRSKPFLFALLVLLALAAGWAWLYRWVDSSSRQWLYESNRPELAAARLEAWSPWMGSPKSWRWLLAEAYRKSGDRARVQRITDNLATSGMDSVRATGPLLLMDATSGMPGRVKDNLGPLLVAYRGNQAEVLASLVQGFLAQGDSMGANQALRLWGELVEGDHQHQYWRGIYFTYEYDLDAAVRAFRKSIELQPNFIRAHQELAEVLLEQAKFEEARAEYEWILEYSEPSNEIITNYARSLLNLGLVDEASEQLAKLKDPNKLPSPELALVCQTNLEASQAQKASEQAAILLERWPNALPYLQLQARCMQQLGRTAESEALFGKAAESQNQRPRVDAMLERLQTDPFNAILRRDLGELMMNYLDPPGGVGYIQVASRANPSDVKSHELIASYMEREGNLESAETHRRILRQIQQAIQDMMDSMPPDEAANGPTPAGPGATGTAPTSPSLLRPVPAADGSGTTQPASNPAS